MVNWQTCCHSSWNFSMFWTYQVVKKILFSGLCCLFFVFYWVELFWLLSIRITCISLLCCHWLLKFDVKRKAFYRFLPFTHDEVLVGNWKLFVGFSIWSNTATCPSHMARPSTGVRRTVARWWLHSVAKSATVPLPHSTSSPTHPHSEPAREEPLSPWQALTWFKMKRLFEGLQSNMESSFNLFSPLVSQFLPWFPLEVSRPNLDFFPPFPKL